MMFTPADSRDPDSSYSHVTRARTALFIGFFMFGVITSSWMARMPSIRTTFDLSEPELGVLLTAMAVGSLASVVLSGTIVAILGTRTTMRTAATMLFLAMMTLAAALTWRIPALLITALLLVGASGPMVNIPLNVSASDVGRALRREILPQFHGAYSAGAVIGSGIASLAAQVGISLSIQSLVIGVIVPAVLIATATRATALSDGEMVASPIATSTANNGHRDPTANRRSRRFNAATTRSSLQAWREPRTLLIGVLVLFGSMSEGTANAWLAIVVVDGVGTSEAMGALAVSIFTSAMMIGRFAGPVVIGRLGRPYTVVGIASLSILGLLIVILTSPIWFIMIGVASWGLGVSLSGPVAVAAAADRREGAAARVSVVTSFGAAGQLVTPPLLGRVAGAVGPRAMLWVVVGALIATIALSPAVRPEQPPKSDDPKPTP